MGLIQGQHVWVRHGSDWVKSVILRFEDDDWLWVQQLGTERSERTHVSCVFEFRPGH